MFRINTKIENYTNEKSTVKCLNGNNCGMQLQCDCNSVMPITIEHILIKYLWHIKFFYCISSRFVRTHGKNTKNSGGQFA